FYVVNRVERLESADESDEAAQPPHPGDAAAVCSIVSCPGASPVPDRPLPAGRLLSEVTCGRSPPASGGVGSPPVGDDVDELPPRTGVERNLLAHMQSGLRSEEHTSELQSRFDLVCRLLLEKKKKYP